jgi:hypothetical protein
MMAKKTDRRRERRNQPAAKPAQPTMRAAWRRTEVRVSALLIGGAGLVFLVESLFLLPRQGVGILYLPLVVFVLNALVTWIVLTGNRVLRPPALVVVVVGVLVHMVILLGGGPIWSRVISGVLAAVSVYALVILNTKPIRIHFGLDTEDE